MTEEEAIKLEALFGSHEKGCHNCKYVKLDKTCTAWCQLRLDGGRCEAYNSWVPLSEPYDDAVKREAVLNTLDTMDAALDENRTVEAYKELLKECYKELPSVTPKSKPGQWIAGPTIGDGFTCSKCNAHYPMYPMSYRFCPICGEEKEGDN